MLAPPSPPVLGSVTRPGDGNQSYHRIASADQRPPSMGGMGHTTRRVWHTASVGRYAAENPREKWSKRVSTALYRRGRRPGWCPGRRTRARDTAQPAPAPGMSTCDREVVWLRGSVVERLRGRVATVRASKRLLCTPSGSQPRADMERDVIEGGPPWMHGWMHGCMDG